MRAQTYQGTSQTACQRVLGVRRSEESRIWWPLGARRRGDCRMWGAPEGSRPERGPSKPMLAVRLAGKVQLLPATLMRHCIAWLQDGSFPRRGDCHIVINAFCDACEATTKGLRAPHTYAKQSHSSGAGEYEDEESDVRELLLKEGLAAAQQAERAKGSVKRMQRGSSVSTSWAVDEGKAGADEEGGSRDIFITEASTETEAEADADRPEVFVSEATGRPDDAGRTGEDEKQEEEEGGDEF